MIYQASYRPSVAIPMSELVGQNDGILGDCVWLLTEAGDEGGWRSYTSSSLAAAVVKGVKRGDLVEILTEEGGNGGTKTAVPGSGVLRVAAKATGEAGSG
jgi:hypothetical protein